MIRALLVMLVMLGAVHRVAADTPDALGSGLALLEEAVKLRTTDPGRSATLGADAAALIESGLGAAGAENPEAQRALGNAWLLGGELGRAVLAYRRAEMAAPHDPLVRSSLAHARSLVGAEAPGAQPAWWRTAAQGWKRFVPRATLFWAGVGLFTLGCLVLALRIVSVLPDRAILPAVGAGVIGLGCVGLLVLEWGLERSDSAVVLAETSGRTGPGVAHYAEALDTPLPAGAEVRVLETREGWAYCAMGELRAWIPDHAVERVRAGTGLFGAPQPAGV